MFSGASVSALQRLVEQLKLEAAVERIKVRPRAPRSRALGTGGGRDHGWRRPGRAKPSMGRRPGRGATSAGMDQPGAPGGVAPPESDLGGLGRGWKSAVDPGGGKREDRGARRRMRGLDVPGGEKLEAPQGGGGCRVGPGREG